MNRLICSAAMCLLALPTFAHADGTTQPAIDTLIAQAKAQNKALVLDFYAVWCKPCKKFDAEVLPRKDVRAALGGVIFHKYDAEKDNGRKAARRYAVRGYPSFLVVDGSGKVRNRVVGSMPAQRFLAFVNQASIDVLDPAGVKKLLAARGKDANTLLAVARWHRSHGDWKKADAMYQRAVKADPNNTKGVAGVAAWECMQLQRYHRARRWIVRSNSSFIKRFPGARQSMTAFSRILHALPQTERDRLARMLLTPMMNDATRLNSAVYVFLAAGAYDVALTAAKRQVALLPKQANPYDTLAEVYHYKGDTTNAVASSNKGIALAKPNELAEFRRNLARFKAPGKLPSISVTQTIHGSKQFLAKLPGVDPSAQKVGGQPRRRSPSMSTMMTFFQDSRAAFRKVAKACAKYKGKLPEVYVRVEFADQTSQKAKKIVVLEPGARWRLKRCLTKQLRQVKWPERPRYYKTRYTSAARFPKK